MLIPVFRSATATSAASNTPTSRGLKALMAISGMENKGVSSESAAFRLIPRINAAGRIGSPEDAVELLLTEDEGRATLLAERLDLYNKNVRKWRKLFLMKHLKK